MKYRVRNEIIVNIEKESQSGNAVKFAHDIRRNLGEIYT